MPRRSLETLRGPERPGTGPRSSDCERGSLIWGSAGQSGRPCERLAAG